MASLSRSALPSPPKRYVPPPPAAHLVHVCVLALHPLSLPLAPSLGLSSFTHCWGGGGGGGGRSISMGYAAAAPYARTAWVTSCAPRFTGGTKYRNITCPRPPPHPVLTWPLTCLHNCGATRSFPAARTVDGSQQLDAQKRLFKELLPLDVFETEEEQAHRYASRPTPRRRARRPRRLLARFSYR